jgi:hypothetical protein
MNLIGFDENPLTTVSSSSNMSGGISYFTLNGSSSRVNLIIFTRPEVLKAGKIGVTAFLTMATGCNLLYG